MPEYLIPPELQAPVDQLLARFREVLGQHTTIIPDDESFTEPQGAEAVEEAARLLEDLGDVVFELNEFLTRDLNERVMPDEAVDTSRAFMDSGQRIHLVLSWRARPLSERWPA